MKEGKCVGVQKKQANVRNEDNLNTGRGGKKKYALARR